MQEVMLKELEGIMREHEDIIKTGQELTKILCDICTIVVHKIYNTRVYLPSTVITATREFSSGGWLQDDFEFCSIECFLKWAKVQSCGFSVYFPENMLQKLNDGIKEFVKNVNTELDKLSLKCDGSHWSKVKQTKQVINERMKEWAES